MIKRILTSIYLPLIQNDGSTAYGNMNYNSNIFNNAIQPEQWFDENNAGDNWGQQISNGQLNPTAPILDDNSMNDQMNNQMNNNQMNNNQMNNNQMNYNNQMNPQMNQMNPQMNQMNPQFNQNMPMNNNITMNYTPMNNNQMNNNQMNQMNKPQTNNPFH